MTSSEHDDDAPVTSAATGLDDDARAARASIERERWRALAELRDAFVVAGRAILRRRGRVGVALAVLGCASMALVFGRGSATRARPAV